MNKTPVKYLRLASSRGMLPSSTQNKNKTKRAEHKQFISRKQPSKNLLPSIKIIHARWYVHKSKHITFLKSSKVNRLKKSWIKINTWLPHV